MNLQTEKSRLDLVYEAARIYLLKVNASHIKIQWSNNKTIIGLGWANIVICHCLANYLFASAFGK